MIVVIESSPEEQQQKQQQPQAPCPAATGARPQAVKLEPGSSSHSNSSNSRGHLGNEQTGQLGPEEDSAAATADDELPFSLFPRPPGEQLFKKKTKKKNKKKKKKRMPVPHEEDSAAATADDELPFSLFPRPPGVYALALRQRGSARAVPPGVYALALRQRGSARAVPTARGRGRARGRGGVQRSRSRSRSPAGASSPPWRLASSETPWHTPAEVEGPLPPLPGARQARYYAFHASHPYGPAVAAGQGVALSLLRGPWIRAIIHRNCRPPTKHWSVESAVNHLIKLYPDQASFPIYWKASSGPQPRPISSSSTPGPAELASVACS